MLAIVIMTVKDNSPIQSTVLMAIEIISAIKSGTEHIFLLLCYPAYDWRLKVAQEVLTINEPCVTGIATEDD